MNNLLSVLLSTLKAKITPIWTKLKYWTSRSFIQAKILTKIRNALSSIFQIKPRNKADYYPLFGWLISKRLARALVVVVGVLCICYFIWVNPFEDISDGISTGEKIYSYDSFPLRFADGEVKIKAEAGYIAYEGNVADGHASGYGQLYGSDGALIYKGNFEKSKYNGNGTLLYPIGQKQYTGEFKDNVFEGKGTMYRENGTKLYQGDFAGGVFEGTGTLYNSADTEVFSGSFHNGELVYSQLLGMTTAGLTEMYKGNRLIYQMDESWTVVLEDIDAIYVTSSGENVLEDDVKVSELYVAKDEFVYGDYKIKTIDELKTVLGSPVFEGNSVITFPEAVGISWMNANGKDIPVNAEISAQELFDGVWSADSYSEDILVYLYVFQVEDITYTFVAGDRNSNFFMYVLE